MEPRYVSRTPLLRPVLLAVTSLPLILSGCSAATHSSDPAAPITPTAALQLSGTAGGGGQQPIAGANVMLYAAGQTGYGTAASVLSSGGQNFVTTDANGAFSIRDTYTCSPGTLLYAVLTGGSSVGPTNANVANFLLTAIGDCSQITSSTAITINPLTTVAAVATLQQFLVLDPSSSMPLIGTSAGNLTGLQNAFLLATTLVPFTTGAAGSNTPGRVLPVSELNTLADALAACVNSTAPAFQGCDTLFANVVNPGGAAPRNTLQAITDVLQHPGAQPEELFFSIPGHAPFQPMLATAPNDWTVALTLKDSSLVQPRNIVLDAAGDAFLFNCAVSCVASASAPDSIVEFGPSGSILTPAGGLTGPAIYNVTGMALDTQGNLWTANDGTTSTGQGNTHDSVGRIPLATPGSATTLTGNLAIPYDLVLDPFGNPYVSNLGSRIIDYVYNQSIFPAENPYFVGVPRGIALRPFPDPGATGTLFVADAGNDSILSFSGQVSSDSGPGSLTFLNGFNYGDVNGPSGIAIGSSGSVWYVNSGGTTVAALDSNGNRIGAALGSQAFGSIATLAIDGNGHAWVPSCNSSCDSEFTGNLHPDSISEIAVSGDGSGLFLLSPTYGFQNSSLSSPAAIAIDGSGNIWVTNADQPSVTVLLGAAAPVQTPVQAALIHNTFGQRP